MGEEFDRDPFLIFKLRGMTREALVERPAGARGAAGMTPLGTETPEETPAAPPEPLPTDAAAFWGGESLGADLLGEVRVPSIAAALPKRLGHFPFWRSREPFLQALERVYTQASPRGLAAVLGTQRPSPRDVDGRSQRTIRDDAGGMRPTWC